MIVVFSIWLSSAKTTNQEQQFKSLELAIIRSAVHCYTIEGAYPQNLEYLEKNYQLELDKETYIIHYEVFAPNMVPEITIIERNN